MRKTLCLQRSELYATLKTQHMNRQFFDVNKNMDFSKVEEWRIPEGDVIRVVDTNTGKILWEKTITVTYWDNIPES